MKTFDKPVFALTAEELMTRDVFMIPLETPLRTAAHLLLEHRVEFAPVVDADGRCVGSISARDFMRWADDGSPEASAPPADACPFRVDGLLLTGEQETICTLPEGCCQFQEGHASTCGRRIMLCRRPTGVLSDWRHEGDAPPPSSASRYITPEAVVVSPKTSLRELLRTMIDGHAYRVVVIDQERRPIGIVSGLDVLNAFSERWRRCAMGEAT